MKKNEWMNKWISDSRVARLGNKTENIVSIHVTILLQI